MGGDFNVCCCPDEKLGISRVTYSIKGFNNFIRDCRLQDHPLADAQFTWSVSGNIVMSFCLDRFLVTNEWEMFLGLIQEVLLHLVSDHLRVKWGPTPFRFENM